MKLIVIDTVDDIVYNEDVEHLLFNAMEDEDIIIEEYVYDEERPRADNIGSVVYHYWELHYVGFSDE